MNIPEIPYTPSGMKARTRRRKQHTAGLPYSSATSGTKAREEIIKVLRRLPAARSQDGQWRVGIK